MTKADRKLSKTFHFIKISYFLTELWMFFYFVGVFLLKRAISNHNSCVSRCWLPNEDRQVWLHCKRKLWSENNSTYLWLYLNQQGALVKEIFRNSELLEFCDLEMYEWSNVNFCITLFSVLLTRRSCNGGVLLFCHQRNQRNIKMVSVRV